MKTNSPRKTKERTPVTKKNGEVQLFPDDPMSDVNECGDNEEHPQRVGIVDEALNEQPPQVASSRQTITRDVHVSEQIVYPGAYREGPNHDSGFDEETPIPGMDDSGIVALASSEQASRPHFVPVAELVVEEDRPGGTESTLTASDGLWSRHRNKLLLVIGGAILVMVGVIAGVVISQTSSSSTSNKNLEPITGTPEPTPMSSTILPTPLPSPTMPPISTPSPTTAGPAATPQPTKMPTTQPSTTPPETLPPTLPPTFPPTPPPTPQPTPPADPCTESFPNPSISFSRVEETPGSENERYWLRINNRQEFPDLLFAAAPDLPPCGQNDEASRTWIDVHRGDGIRLQGFCGFSSSPLEVWFAATPGEVGSAYVVFEDRRCGVEYRSNTVSIPVPPTSPPTRPPTSPTPLPTPPPTPPTNPCSVSFPNPSISFSMVEEISGSENQRYWISIDNHNSFSSDLFDPSPDLPPCGLNEDASRTWIDVYGNGNRVQRFCGFSSAPLAVWFAAELGEITSAFVVFMDRRCSVDYTSNVISIPS